MRSYCFFFLSFEKPLPRLKNLFFVGHFSLRTLRFFNKKKGKRQKKRMENSENNNRKVKGWWYQTTKEPVIDGRLLLSSSFQNDLTILHASVYPPLFFSSSMDLTIFRSIVLVFGTERKRSKRFKRTSRPQSHEP